ncbi:hypothetical protein F4823DRAFT_86833 [Ustulina deusta]|nr:hypothetical protein F4823DRAFT_86833 [Ustulina deusta]
MLSSHAAAGSNPDKVHARVPKRPGPTVGSVGSVGIRPGNACNLQTPSNCRVISSAASQHSPQSPPIDGNFTCVIANNHIILSKSQAPPHLTTPINCQNDTPFRPAGVRACSACWTAWHDHHGLPVAVPAPRRTDDSMPTSLVSAWPTSNVPQSATCSTARPREASPSRATRPSRAIDEARLTATPPASPRRHLVSMSVHLYLHDAHTYAILHAETQADLAPQPQPGTAAMLTV